MRNLLLALLLAISSTATIGCSKGGDDKQHAGPVANLAIADVEAALAAKQAHLVDCNSPQTRQKWGIIPGAILVDDEDKFEAKILPQDKTAKLVFYCSGPG